VADAFRDGRRVGVRYWSRLPSGEEVDLTRDQFLPNEAVGEGAGLERPSAVPKPGPQNAGRANSLAPLGLLVVSSVG
jgi:hypothetical protein